MGLVKEGWWSRLVERELCSSFQDWHHFSILTVTVVFLPSPDLLNHGKMEVMAAPSLPGLGYNQFDFLIWDLHVHL